jgi:hypothetical protein
VDLPAGNTMVFRVLAISFVLIFGGLLLSGVVAQTPAALSYGSLAPAENTTILSANSGTFSPAYVAQNTTPAPISPTPNPTPVLPSPPTASVLPPFDPYAVSTQPSWFSSVIPVGSTSGQSQPMFSDIYSGNFDRFVPETYEAVKRFRDATSFEYTHLPRGSKAKGFGMDEIDMRLQLAFPCRFIPNNGQPGYFYVAPSGRLVWWNGPTSPDMPPNGFGTFLDFSVQPKFNDSFSLIAWGRFGISSDFNNMSSDAFRYQAHLEGIGRISPNMHLHAGVIYYGRARVKMLPTMGVVWKPDENWVFRLVFPNPKISRRLWMGPQADWWGYVRMDYSGGSWDIENYGLTDYNDIRLGTGIDFDSPGVMGGYFEFGGSFARELYYGGHSTSLPAALYLKMGIIF